MYMSLSIRPLCNGCTAGQERSPSNAADALLRRLTALLYRPGPNERLGAALAVQAVAPWLMKTQVSDGISRVKSLTWVHNGCLNEVFYTCSLILKQ